MIQKTRAFRGLSHFRGMAIRLHVAAVMIRIAIMADVKNLPPEIILHIAQSLNRPVHSLSAVIGLLNDGGTVPFIARYRKEATGNLDEVQIRDIEDKLGLLPRARQPPRNYLGSILEQGKLSDELKARIEATFDKSELEDLTCRTVRSGGPRRRSLAITASNPSPTTFGRSSPRYSPSAITLPRSSIQKRK